jgi:cytoplasmic iron level regulating protein YaaA (DUF328/UPF0246 family)
MKFKIGDKVRVIALEPWDYEYGWRLGDVFTIDKVDSFYKYYYRAMNIRALNESQLELVEEGAPASYIFGIDPADSFPQQYPCEFNEKIKTNKTIMNKITSQIKRIFNPSLQKQYKAGLIDNCGNLTISGEAELKALLRDKFNTEFTKIAEDIIKEEKE